MSEETIIGIDLGTTYSCVGVCDKGRVTIIPNNYGVTTTPSIVSFFKNERMIGQAAKNQMIKNYKNTIYDSKRLIGRRFSDKEVQNDLKLWPFKVKKDENTDKPIIIVNYKNEETEFLPEQISSMILQHLKKNAEEYLGKKINKAVITVPANFNDSQRQATIDAAKIAKINVVNIVNEPTAAAICFGLENTFTEKKKICVLDFGGGTFDISILEIENKSFNVIATDGNSHLGGQDFDNELVKYCVSEFKKKTGIDLNYNMKALRRLKINCEERKKELSSANETSFDIDVIAEGEDFCMNIYRSTFEKICEPLVKECLKTIEKTFERSKYKKEDIDNIILVGGTTRIPMIKKRIEEFFKKKNDINDNKIIAKINKDEAIAYGAAMIATQYNNYISKNILNFEIKDVNPHTLGISSNGGKMSVIIPKNTPIPCKKSKRFRTIFKNQTSFGIGIYEGENENIDDNYNLDNFIIDNITQDEKGKVTMKVTFSLDKDCILTVTAEEENKMNKKELIVKREKQSKIDVNKLAISENLMNENDIKKSKTIEVKKKLENLLETILESKTIYKLNLQNKASEMNEWLRNSQNEEFNVYQSKILEMEKEMTE